MLEIKTVKKTRAGLRVDWESDLDVSALSIVFDDEGSCTSIGLELDALHFTATNLSAHRTYEIYLKALTVDGWQTSKSFVYRLV